MKFTLSRFAFKAIPISLALALTACGGFSDGPERVLSGGAVRELDPGLQAALCQGRASDVVMALTNEPLMSPTDQFYLALAHEEAGALPRARSLYAGVMQTKSEDSVSARCADRLLASGPVADEAGRHLANISQHLAALDVDLAPDQPLHDGLPKTGPRRIVEPARSLSGGLTSGFASSALSYTGGANQSVSRPPSQSPLGQWFANLTSYRSMENAMKNRSTLERKFPGLAGIIDQWELQVGGSLAIRLGVRMGDRNEANALCNAVKSQGEYCAVIDTSS